MFDPGWPLWADVLVFLGAAGVIAAAGSRMAGLGDRLADRTGMGEAMTGTLLLGLSTSLPGLVASVTAALDGRASLAISNAIGGIAAQTAFLGIADVAYRKANLEHASASIANVVQVTVLLALLTLVLLGISGPGLAIGPVAPVTPVLLVSTLLGYRLAFKTGSAPMWRPERTEETVEDTPGPVPEGESVAGLALRFAACAAIVGVAGFAVARATGHFGERTGLSQSLMGGLFAAIATSLPELVTVVAAVRRGALTLAVADIVGGNVFDVLFLVAADLAFLGGSIYHAEGVGRREVFLVALTILLNVVLLLGLVYREKHGPANIGFESVLMLVLYLIGFATMLTLPAAAIGS